jgi:hypothetical protein
MWVLTSSTGLAGLPADGLDQSLVAPTGKVHLAVPSVRVNTRTYNTHKSKSEHSSHKSKLKSFFSVCKHSGALACGGLRVVLPGQSVASLETLSIKESFLGIASALLGFGRLAMHNKSPESLCHATQERLHGGSHQGSHV